MFTSKVFGEFLVEKGIKHVKNEIATLRVNKQVERTNRTIMLLGQVARNCVGCELYINLST